MDLLRKRVTDPLLDRALGATRVLAMYLIRTLSHSLYKSICLNGAAEQEDKRFSLMISLEQKIIRHIVE